MVLLQIQHTPVKCGHDVYNSRISPTTMTYTLRPDLLRKTTISPDFLATIGPYYSYFGTPEGQAPSVRKKGKCKWFNVVKKYGFIKPSDGGQDVFVHQSVIQRSGFRSLADEEEVEYECRCSDKGVEATLVCGPNGSDCKGRPPRQRKFKCYNCGEYSNHLALKCPKGPLPKSCYECLGCDHLIKDCPKRDTKSTGNDESSNDESSSKHIKTSGKSVQGT